MKGGAHISAGTGKANLEKAGAVHYAPAVLDCGSPAALPPQARDAKAAEDCRSGYRSFEIALVRR
jgi:hypothetical protein